MWIELRQEFNEQIKASELPIRTAVGKTIRLLQTLEDVSQLWKHHGLNFEKLHGYIDQETGEQLYSIRITQSARALTCLLKGPTIVPVSLHPEHDKTYRKH